MNLVKALRNGRFRREEDGGSLIEFPICIGVLLTLVLCLMQMCMAFYSYGMICECAREATRWAIVRGSTCTTSTSTSCTTTTTAITNFAKGTGLPNIAGGTMNVTTTFPDTYNSVANCEAPVSCRVQVSITYTVPVRIPLVPRTSYTLSTSSEMYFLQ